MHEIAEDHPAGGGDLDVAPLKWADGHKRTWLIALSPDRIELRSGADTIDLPSSSWGRDVHVTPHGNGYIIRFETFDAGAAFVVTAEQATPLLAHIGAASAPSKVNEQIDETPVTNVKVMWPKVSPLAVWALISSSLVFVPVLGLLPALVTVILLTMHRTRVRRARAWNHSRRICTVAAVFLVAGLVVSVMATLSMARTSERMHNSPRYGYASPPTDAGHYSATTLRAQTAQSGGWPWEREHNWGIIAAGLLVVLLSLTFHEAGHAISAWWLGDDFAERSGRVTLNPRAHIDPIGTVLLPLILFMADAGVFGWARPVPVRTEVLANPRRGHILISIAGPGANLLLAAASMLLLLGLGCLVTLAAPAAMVDHFASLDVTTAVTASGFTLAWLFGPVCTILKLSFVINVFLACFNLIPIPPLDGSWVLKHLFPRTVGPFYDRIRPYGFLIFLFVLYSDLFQYLLYPALLALAPGLVLLEVCTPF